MRFFYSLFCLAMAMLIWHLFFNYGISSDIGRGECGFIYSAEVNEFGDFLFNFCAILIFLIIPLVGLKIIFNAGIFPLFLGVILGGVATLLVVFAGMFFFFGDNAVACDIGDVSSQAGVFVNLVLSLISACAAMKVKR